MRLPGSQFCHFSLLPLSNLSPPCHLHPQHSSSCSIMSHLDSCKCLQAGLPDSTCASARAFSRHVTRMLFFSGLRSPIALSRNPKLCYSAEGPFLILHLLCLSAYLLVSLIQAYRTDFSSFGSFSFTFKLVHRLFLKPEILLSSFSFHSFLSLPSLLFMEEEPLFFLQGCLRCRFLWEAFLGLI